MEEVMTSWWKSESWSPTWLRRQDVAGIITVLAETACDGGGYRRLVFIKRREGGLVKAGNQGWNYWSNASWSNTKPTNNPTTVPTWNGDTKLFDDYEFDVLMDKRGSNPGDHCFLVPRLISGLTGRAREHLRLAGDLDRFAVDGGLEQFLEHLKTKMGIRRPQEEVKRARRRVHDKSDQQI